MASFLDQTPRNGGPVDPLLTDNESAELLHMSGPTFHRRVADGTVPKPLKFGHLSRWPRSEILAVIEAAKARRLSQSAPPPVLDHAEGNLTPSIMARRHPPNAPPLLDVAERNSSPPIAALARSSGVIKRKPNV
jgi:predicted DNA-binding transcriptional regulator AlpA